MSDEQPESPVSDATQIAIVSSVDLEAFMAQGFDREEAFVLTAKLFDFRMSLAFRNMT